MLLVLVLGMPLIVFVLTINSTGIGEVLNPITGAIWMDRNLGASQVATSSTDAASYGDLYQWGRDADGHQLRTSDTTSTLSSTDVPGHAKWILSTTDFYDWRSTQNTNLWQGVNGVNNPCPSGYRIPTSTELDAELLSWSSNNAAGAFASPLKLPLAGARNGSTTGAVSSVALGLYWSSTIISTIPTSQRLYFGISNSGIDEVSRSAGMSVRCIKD